MVTKIVFFTGCGYTIRKNHYFCTLKSDRKILNINNNYR